MKIRITIAGLSMEATLVDTPTTRSLGKALPLSAPFDTWGEEIYFTVPVEEDLDETAREEVEVGDLGYWPRGNAFCIFFGQTPMSRAGRITPASAVNVIGRVDGDATRFREVIDEGEVILEAV